MKISKLIRTGFLCTAFLAAGAVNSFAADLTLRITGAKNSEGRIMVAVGEMHGDTNEDIRTAMVPATTGTAEIVLKDLPEGEISIYVFHDENSNYKLDMSADGIPAEGCMITKVNLRRGANNMDVQLKYY